MTCEEAVDALAGLEPGEAPLPEVLEHLRGCEACRGKAEGFGELDELARRALPLKRRRPLLPYGIAAAVLLAAGVWGFHRTASPPALPPAAEMSGAFLEADGDATLSGRTLTLRSGACWLDTTVPIELPAFSIRFEAGTEAEVRILQPKRISLLSDAWAGEDELLVSVVSGCAWRGSLRIPAGSRVRLPSGVLETLDAASIDAWRARRLESGKPGPERTLRDAEFASFAVRSSFSAEVRSVKGYVVLRYPAGETTLGNLDAWKDGAWHRLGVAWRGSGTEIFLDGRRILKVPGSSGTLAPGLGVRGGALVMKENLP